MIPMLWRVVCVSWRSIAPSRENGKKAKSTKTKGKTTNVKNLMNKIFNTGPAVEESIQLLAFARSQSPARAHGCSGKRGARYEPGECRCDLRKDYRG